MMYTKYNKMFLTLNDIETPAHVTHNGQNIPGVYAIDIANRYVHKYQYDAKGETIIDKSNTDVLREQVQYNSLKVTLDSTGETLVEWS